MLCPSYDLDPTSISRRSELSLVLEPAVEAVQNAVVAIGFGWVITIEEHSNSALVIGRLHLSQER